MNPPIVPTYRTQRVGNVFLQLQSHCENRPTKMQRILSFDTETRVAKRHKAARACRRCKDSKKRCDVSLNTTRCDRCDTYNLMCSFETMSSSDTSWKQQPEGQDILRPFSATRFPSASLLAEQSRITNGANSSSATEPESNLLAQREIFISRPLSPPLSTSVTDSPLADAQEYRYATMLSLLESRSGNKRKTDIRQPVKLISGTNPLSALLGKELKHTIVTNSCAFRTPDPISQPIQPTPRGGSGIHSCDWRKLYDSYSISAPQMQFLDAIGCFELPSPARCAELLEVFFTHIHPMLPVIDRRDFLSSYYGSDKPPRLITLHAVFLASSRYITGTSQSVDGVPEVRSLCDKIHAKVRALVDVEIPHDRLAVIQASLISSLHWEGREGLNSALDSLGFAVRACQEMGLHRKKEPAQQSDPEVTERHKFHRRLWWSTYTLDRLCAAQEGTPFLINERDCDVELLTKDDLSHEDNITVDASLINLSLAQVVEDTVRNFYQPTENVVPFSHEGVSKRQELVTKLDALEDCIKSRLLSGQEVQQALKNDPKTMSISCGIILLTHLNALRILVYRLFLLHCEPPGSGVHFARDACRRHARDIVSYLQSLYMYDSLKISWPFTVYAVVNCLLIFWYDVSSPPMTTQNTLEEAHRNYLDVVNLLRVMGDRWWAAAAKHKLSLALARVANIFHSKEEPNNNRTIEEETPSATTTTIATIDSGIEDSFPKPTNQNHLDLNGLEDIDLFSDYNSAEYWSMLGLDFDQDVAPSIFSIEPM